MAKTILTVTHYCLCSILNIGSGGDCRSFIQVVLSINSLRPRNLGPSGDCLKCVTLKGNHLKESTRDWEALVPPPLNLLS